MIHQQLIQTHACNRNGDCPDDLCPKSLTPVCCFKCGSPEHIEQVIQNYKELSEDPDFRHPAIDSERDTIIQIIKTQHKCRHTDTPCKGKRVFRITSL